MIVVRDFCEHALLSLNKNYQNHLIVEKTKNSKLLKLINFDRIDEIITGIMVEIILKYDVYIYFYIFDKKYI